MWFGRVISILLLFAIWMATGGRCYANVPVQEPEPEPQPVVEPQVEEIISSRIELPAIADSVWFMEYPEGEFAMEYSPEKRHPKWVAWKMHAGYYGTYNRTNAWHYDSRLELYSVRQADFQKQFDFRDPNLVISYDRGHLCPSNDRKASAEMNAETFVYTNMSPQLGAFNQGIWAKLESMINRWAAVEGDTLYICAGGTVLRDEDIAAYTLPDHAAIPKYYFKVVVRKRGEDKFDAVGFWFEHRDYGRKNADLIANLKNIIMTVDSIEALTGIDFFHSLPAGLQERIEQGVDMDAWNWSFK